MIYIFFIILSFIFFYLITIFFKLEFKKYVFLFIWWMLAFLIIYFIWKIMWSSFEINIFNINKTIIVENYINIINELIFIWKDNYLLYSFLLPSFLEESLKILVLIFLNIKLKILKNIYHVIIWAVSVALWFSFLENAIYLLNDFYRNWIDYMFLSYRLIISSLSHILFSIISAYFIWLFLFIDYSFVDKKRIFCMKLTKKIIIWNFKLIHLIKIKFLLLAVIISSFIHSFYNYNLIIWNFKLAIAIILIWILISIFYFHTINFKKDNNYMEYKLRIKNLKKSQ